MPSNRSDKKSQNVVFFHPDLGIGGAERLIIDAAVGLQDLGHKVVIFTSHCDPQHCFDEARDGTLDVRVRGNNLLPPTILNRFHILLATLRQIHLVLTIAVFSTELRQLKPNTFIVDQLSACVPLLRWLWPSQQRILFYCHFPDQLLARRDDKGGFGFIKNLYRYPFDWFEGWSMSGSDRIVVNSNFTKSVVKRVFPNLNDLGVVYPCVDVSQPPDPSSQPLWPQKKILLSINRFERKKNIALAIAAYAALPISLRKSSRLVLAGGYDPRVAENVSYHAELVALADKHTLSNATCNTVPTALAIPSNVEVLFLLSVPSAFKTILLSSAKLLIYTPKNEHFGIVPIEAMQYGVPVLASNTGGPLETVLEGKTGWLRDVELVDRWTGVMTRVLDVSNREILERMSSQGKERVRSEFTREIMARRLEAEVFGMLGEKRAAFVEYQDILLAVGVCGVFVAAFIALINKAMFPRKFEIVRGRGRGRGQGQGQGQGREL